MASSLLGFILLFVGEMLVIPVVWPYFNMTFEKLASATLVHIFGGYLSDSLLMILAIVVGLTRFSLIKPKID